MSYDPYAEFPYESAQWQSFSDDLWSLSSGFDHMGDQAWLASQYDDAWQMYQVSDAMEDLSAQAYEQSWEAWYGPVNAEGYTAYDAAHGYTTMDTSFIEPASSAGSMSMISSYDTSGNL